MAIKSRFAWIFLIAVLLSFSGCANVKPRDYSAFRESNPRSLLVLPPLNHSPDIKASGSVLSLTTLPLAESGYYVIPVGVMTETFRQNGLDNPEDIQSVNISKLRDIFGADAALYMEITEYGSSYKIISSDTVVTANAKLVDLRTGTTIWDGTASASSAEDRDNSQGGIVGMLLVAIVEQVVNTTTDKGHTIAARMNERLLTAGQPYGLLYGPRSPNFGKNQSRPWTSVRPL